MFASLSPSHACVHKLFGEKNSHTGETMKFGMVIKG